MLYIFCNNFYLAVPYKRHPLTEGIQTNIIIPKFLLQMYHMSHATLYWYSVHCTGTSTITTRRPDRTAATGIIPTIVR